MLKKFLLFALVLVSFVCGMKHRDDDNEDAMACRLLVNSMEYYLNEGITHKKLLQAFRNACSYIPDKSVKKYIILFWKKVGDLAIKGIEWAIELISKGFRMIFNDNSKQIT